MYDIINRHRKDVQNTQQSINRKNFLNLHKTAETITLNGDRQNCLLTNKKG